jgi:hypothetical protein
MVNCSNCSMVARPVGARSTCCQAQTIAVLVHDTAVGVCSCMRSKLQLGRCNCKCVCVLTCSSTGKRPAGTDVLKGLLSQETSRYLLSGEAATLQHSKSSMVGGTAQHNMWATQHHRVKTRSTVKDIAEHQSCIWLLGALPSQVSKDSCKLCWATHSLSLLAARTQHCAPYS